MQNRIVGRGTDGQTSSLTVRSIQGLFWMFSGAGVQVILQIAALAVLARLLSPEDFGLVSAALVFVSFSTIFADLGVGPALVQHPALRREHIGAGFAVSLFLGALIAAVLFWIAPLAAEMFRMEPLVDILRVLSVIFFVKGLSVVGESLLQRDLRFRRLAGIDLVSYVLGYGLVGVILAVMGAGVWSLVGAHIGQAFAKMVLVMAAQPVLPTFRFTGAAIAELFRFGGGVSLSRVANYLAQQADNFVVGRWLGANALGVYGRAYQITSLPARTLGNGLDKVLFPAMSKVQAHPGRLATAFRRAVLANFLAIAPGSVLIISVTPEIVALILGHQWTEAILPIQLLAAGMVFRTQDRITAVVARAVGAVYRRAALQVVYALMIFIAAFVGIRWDIAGVAAGVGVALVANAAFTALLCIRLVPVSFSEFLRAHAPGGIMALAMGLSTWTTADLLRSWGGKGLFVILCTLFAGLLSAAVVFPVIRRVAGRDREWVLEIVSRVLPFELSFGQRTMPG